MSRPLSIPKLLTTRHLLSDDIGKAGEEAAFNACRLVQAGQFDAAFRVSLALVSPGSWRTSRQFAYRYQVLCHLCWLSQRLGRPVELGEDDDFANMAREWLKAPFSAAPGYYLQPPAPRGWSMAELEAAVASVRPDNFGGTFNKFQADARDELLRRIDARARKQPRADAGDHAAIADAFERGALLAFPKEAYTYAGEPGVAAAVLDLLGGDKQAATVRLGRVLPKQPASLGTNYWRLEVYADFLASRALAPALAIDDAGTAAYLATFATRSPYTITTTKPKPWKQVLKAWVERLRDDGLDAAALVDTLAAGEPGSKALLAKAKKGQPLNGAASADAIAALEARIGKPLPPSYREFLLVADGLIVPWFVALLPTAEVDWLDVLDPHTVEAWNRDEEEASDEDYAIYGADQDCIHMRPRHLRKALQVSTMSDGDVLLLVPGVRFGDEWEAWFLGAKNPGAYRFKSFRALMEQRVLAEGDG